MAGLLVRGAGRPQPAQACDLRGRPRVRGRRLPPGTGPRACSRSPLGHSGRLPLGVAQDVRGPGRHLGRRLPGDHDGGRPRHDPREEDPGGPLDGCA
eukprot:1897661-Alexandrium_andersonii.AAC.1